MVSLIITTVRVPMSQNLVTFCAHIQVELGCVIHYLLEFQTRETTDLTHCNRSTFLQFQMQENV